jgi:hypothetical protein
VISCLKDMEVSLGTYWVILRDLDNDVQSFCLAIFNPRSSVSMFECSKRVFMDGIFRIMEEVLKPELWLARSASLTDTKPLADQFG